MATSTRTQSDECTNIEIDIELLISLVETRPALWDKNADGYKDNTTKTLAWNGICSILNKRFGLLDEKSKAIYAKCVLGKWTNIRDCWKKCMNKQNDSSRTGTGKRSRPYLYHKQLKFLMKTIQSGHQHTDEIAKQENDQIFEEVSFDGTDYMDPLSNTSTSIEEVYLQPVKKKKKCNEFDTEVSSCTDSNITEPAKEDHNRHLLFFKSLLPSLAVLHDEQTLEFQTEVLTTLQKIKRRRTCTNESYVVSPKLNYSDL